MRFAKALAVAIPCATWSGHVLADDNALVEKMSLADRLLYERIQQEIIRNKLNPFTKLCKVCGLIDEAENIGYEKSRQEILDRYR